MKKMTIALFTAAAMGTSAFAVADEHGPTISGDIRFIYNDNNTDTPDTQNQISNNRLKLAVSGASDAGNGNEAFYYFRMSSKNNDPTVDYKFIGMRGDFGSLQVGNDDDLVYKFAGAHTDLFRGQLPGGSAAGNATYSTDYAFYDPSVQYSVDINDLTIAAFADTSADDGVERSQAAASYDFGPATVAGIYSNSDKGGDDLFGSISMDLGVATLGASVGSREDGTNPISIALSGDVTETLSAQVGYADDNNGTADTIGQVIANLGGGMSVFGNYRIGDSENGFVVGAQLNY
jgi:hypothetical protein